MLPPLILRLPHIPLHRRKSLGGVKTTRNGAAHLRGMEKVCRNPRRHPGIEAAHSTAITERLEDGTGDFGKSFVAPTRVDVEKLIGGICFLARERSRRLLP